MARKEPTGTESPSLLASQFYLLYTLSINGGTMKKLVCLIVICYLLHPANSIAGSGTVEITEWKVPWKNTRPRDPYVDRQGRVWFVGQKGDYIAYLNPATGNFKRYDLDDGTGPHNLVVDRTGMVWYAGNRAAHIGLLNPENGSVKKYAMPLEDAYDPHTLVFGPSGDIWFTVQGGNYVGRLTMKSGNVELFPVPTKKARPYGIIMSPDGVPWFTEFGSYKLGRINRNTLSVEETVLPRKEARPRRLAATSDGTIWYVDYREGYLGKLDVHGNTFKEWLTPGGTDALPYGMVVDREDRLWFVETGPSPNRFIGFDPRTESFTSSTGIRSGGGSVRHMFYDTEKHEIWFGTDTDTIGRARLP
jgi:virginiamycin B lyase